MFGQLHRTSSWLIGDLLNHIERVYGETYAQAAEITGLSKGALMNYTSVCAHIPRSRRRPKVAFSTHMEVAYLEPAEQDRWLKEAEKHKWTKEELRAQRRARTATLRSWLSVRATVGISTRSKLKQRSRLRAWIMFGSRTMLSTTRNTRAESLRRTTSTRRRV